MQHSLSARKFSVKPKEEKLRFLPAESICSACNQLPCLHHFEHLLLGHPAQQLCDESPLVAPSPLFLQASVKLGVRKLLAKNAFSMQRWVLGMIGQWQETFAFETCTFVDSSKGESLCKRSYLADSGHLFRIKRHPVDVCAQLILPPASCKHAESGPSHSKAFCTCTTEAWHALYFSSHTLSRILAWIFAPQGQRDSQERYVEAGEHTSSGSSWRSCPLRIPR